MAAPFNASTAITNSDIVARVSQYSWMLPVGAPIAFLMACGMGANELSSNWGNVFGARALKLWQIVLVAAVFEFIGAIAMGEGTASAIRGGIMNRDRFRDYPEDLMLGYLVVLITCAVWLYIANRYGLPVSDSQTTVLSLVGVGLGAYGANAVIWAPPTTDTTNFMTGGLSRIGITWVISPISAAIISSLFFFAVKYGILNAQNPSLRAKQAFPIFVFVVLFINVFFFMFESPAIEDKLEPWMKAMIALGISIGLTVLATFTYRTWILKKIAEAEAGLGQSIAEAGSMEMVPSSQPIIPASQDEKKEDETAAETKEEEAKDEARLAAFQGDDLPPVYNEGGELKVSHPTDTVAEASVPLKGFTTKMESFLGRYKYTRWLVVDHHAEAFNRDQHLDKLHNKTTESYAVGVEMMFLHLLIITACFKSFSHGASDVSNTAGPLAGIINILDDGRIDRNSVIPFWTLALGAAGMATGILTYGYKTLTMLGVKVTRISPVRGVCMDMSTAIVIIVATYLQIPVSSTQVTVGSIIGVGLASGTLNQFGKKLHWGNLAVIFLGWLVTLIFSAGLSYILYSLIYRSPNFTAAALRPTIIQSRNLTIQNNFLQSLNVNLTNNLTNLSNNLTNAYAEINTLKALVANLTANPTVF